MSSSNRKRRMRASEALSLAEGDGIGEQAAMAIAAEMGGFEDCEDFCLSLIAESEPSPKREKPQKSLSRQDRNWLKREMGKWSEAVKPLGLEVTESPHAYEWAKVTGEGVALVIYHTDYCIARNSYVRNCNSRDAAKAIEAIDALALPCKTRPKV